MKGGRPLRFLALWLGGWATARTVLTWPVAETLEALTRAVASPAAAATALVAVAQPLPPRATVPPPVRATLAEVPHAAAATMAAPVIQPPREPVAPAPMPTIVPPPTLAAIASGPSRLALSAWGIVRGGTEEAASSGQLGGSQLGVRMTYALDTARRLAASARLSAPLQGRGKELALGLDWQPIAAPVHVIVEQRLSLDGGSGGPTALLVGGFGPKDLAHGFRAEGYAQAGAIARRRVDAFGDGALRVARPVARIGATSIDIGAGSWGGAQRGAARLDLGPSIGIAAPVGDKRVRLTLDWRERVAGSARPGSAPALSIGSDL